MMRKRNYTLLTAGLLVLAIAAGCSSDTGNQEPVIFQQKENEDYVSIIWNDREYVPYCAISPAERGEYLGYMEDDPDVEIYELDGYSSEEWIIDYLNLKSCGEAMLYKEVNVRDIPDGFSSEYEWNHMEDEACVWLPTALYFL